MSAAWPTELCNVIFYLFLSCLTQGSLLLVRDGPDNGLADMRQWFVVSTGPFGPSTSCGAISFVEAFVLQPLKLLL